TRAPRLAPPVAGRRGRVPCLRARVDPVDDPDGVELPRAIGARHGAPGARLLAARAGPPRASELGVLDVGDVSPLRARARWRVARTLRRGPVRHAAPAVDGAPAGERRARRGAGGGDARGSATAAIRAKGLRSNRPNGSRSNDRRSILDPRGLRM